MQGWAGVLAWPLRQTGRSAYSDGFWSGDDGIRYGTGVTDVTLTYPSAGWLASFPATVRCDLAVNPSLSVPPSPLHVHDGGWTASLHEITLLESSQRPCPSFVNDVIVIVGGGVHVKSFTKPTWLTLVMITS